MNTVSTTATAYKNIAVFDPVFTIFWCLILKVGIKGAIVEFAGSGEYAVGCGEADFVFVAAHAFYFDVAQPGRAVGCPVAGDVVLRGDAGNAKHHNAHKCDKFFHKICFLILS